MDVLFVSGVAPIVADLPAALRLYGGALGLELEGEDYPHTDRLGGVRHFGVWPLQAAAQACFGEPEWPAGRPVPQASIEFEVASVAAVATAAAELAAAGFDVLHPSRTEPWGQTVARVQSADGLIVGISHAPWMHDTG